MKGRNISGNERGIPRNEDTILLHAPFGGTACGGGKEELEPLLESSFRLQPRTFYRLSSPEGSVVIDSAGAAAVRSKMTQPSSKHPCDLFLDAPQAKLWCRGRRHRALERCPTLLRVLRSLAADSPKDRRTIYEEAWRRRFNEEFHHNNVYVAIVKLRKMLEPFLGGEAIVTYRGEGLYSISPSLSWLKLEELSPLEAARNIPPLRRKMVLELLSLGGECSMADLRERLELPTTTMRRVLGILCAEGKVGRRRLGNTTLYSLKKERTR